MTYFLVNVILALLWAALLGEFTVTKVLTGFVIGYLILGFISLKKPSNYFRKSWQLIKLIVFFFYEFMSSSVRVSAEVLSPKLRCRPAIVALPVSAESELEISMLAILISLTPGTLSLDVNPDKKVIYVHAMFADDVEALRKELRHYFERPLRELLA